MADPATAKPSDKSADIKAMSGYWEQIEAILGGVDTMRLGGEKYLPKFPMEDKTDYQFRLKNSKFTNVFRDIVENLAAKPFTEEAGVTENSASPRVKDLVEDIDGKGNNLHVFAQTAFFNGISNAIDWILVDYTKDVPQGASIAEEKALGARPYFVPICADRMIAVYSDRVGGTEVFTHIRYCEDTIERSGFGETVKKRIRVWNRDAIVDADNKVTGYLPATWQLLEEQTKSTGEKEWIEIDKGVVTIGIIPLVPFVTGRRKGASWQFIPPMKDAADLQIELYQAENGLKHAKESTAFPMLSGNGVEPALDEAGNPKAIRIGPKAVLYAPPQASGRPGSWQFIEPDASSLTFLQSDIKETINSLRELGRQPLTAQTGNLTVVTTAFAAQKGNSAIQAWALNLKDALERAFVIVAMWLKETKEAEVTINTDFDVDMNDDKGIEALIAMRYPTNGSQPDLSQRTFWHEMRRRSVLSPEFDADTEDENIIDELPGDTEDTIPVNPSATPPIKPVPGVAPAAP